jgi:Zn-dependent alcohol dehydrogenase
VAILGTGGVGVNAVQGARIAGHAGSSPSIQWSFKRGQALRPGATQAYAPLDDAGARVGELTWGESATRPRRQPRRLSDRVGGVDGSVRRKVLAPVI